MKDTADDEHEENRPRDQRTIGHEVPPEAKWEMAVQKPVDDDQPGGLTTTIVYAVAEAEGVEPVDVKNPPLFDVIDAAALEATYFRSDGVSRTEDGQSTTEFMYRDHRVVVRSDGWVFVHDRVDD